MADQNQTVHTVFTGEAQLEDAKRELDAFVKDWEGRLAQIAKATEGVNQNTLKVIQTYNQVTSSVKRFQDQLNRYTPKPDSGGARSKGDIQKEAASQEAELFAYRKRVSKAMAGTVLEIDDQIAALEARIAQMGKARRKYAQEIAETNAELDRLQNSRRTIASNTFVANELASARSDKAKQALRDAAADDRTATRAAQELTNAKLRLAEVEAQLATLDARAGGRAPKQISALRQEQTALNELIKAYEGVAAVMDRAARSQGKMLNTSLVAQRRNVVTQARAYMENQARAGEINATLGGANPPDAQRRAALEAELASIREANKLTEQDAAIMERVAVLTQRAAEAEQRRADAEAKRVQREAEAAAAREKRENATAARRAKADAAEAERQRKREEAEAKAAARAPDQAAQKYLAVEKQIIAAEEEIARQKALGSKGNAETITLLEGELQRLREQTAELLKQEGIEGRITLLRAQAYKEPPAPKAPAGPRTVSLPKNILAVQAELMANYAALNAMQTSASALVQYIVQDEQALAQFQAIAAASNVETAKLSDTINNLGQHTKFTNLELTQAATLLAQAGLSAKDTETALPAIATLAAAAGTDLEKAADVVTSVASVWNMSTQQYGKIADVLTNALNRTKLSMDQLQEGIQYSANTAEEANIDFVELTSALGAMAQAGIRSGSTLGTGLRSLIVDLQTPTAKAQQIFDRLGLTFGDLDIRTLGLTQVMTNLKSAGFTTADAMAAFEKRSGAAYAALSNNLDVMQDLEKGLTATGAAAEANDVQMDTLAAKWTKFTNALKDAGNEGFAPIVSVLKITLDLATALVGVLDHGGPVIQGTATAMTILSASFLVDKIKDGAKALQDVVTGLKATTTATQEVAVAQTEQAAAAEASAAANEAAAVAETAAAEGATVLGISLKGIPILGTIALLSGLAVAALSTFGVFKKGSDEADHLKGEMNDLSSRMQETRTTLEAVDNQITRLTTSADTLAKNPVLRDRLLEETRDRFESVGLKVKGTTSSIDDMVRALKDLRSELHQNLSSEWTALENNLKAQINLKDQDLRAGNYDQKSQDAFYQSYLHHGKALQSDRRLGAANSDAMQYAFDVLMRNTSLVDDNYRPVGLPQAEGAQQSLTKLRDQLQQERDKSTDRGFQAKADKDLAYLDTMLTGLGQAIGAVRSVQELQSRVGDTQQKVALEQLLADKNNPATKLLDNIDEVLKPFHSQAEEIRSANMKPNERVHAADRLQNEAQVAFNAQINQAIQASAGLPADLRQGYLDAFRERGTANLSSLTSFIPETMRQTASQGDKQDTAAAQRDLDANQGVNKDLADSRLAAVKKQISDLQDRIGKARSSAEIAQLRQQAVALFAELSTLSDQANVADLQAKGFYDMVGKANTLVPLVTGAESSGRPGAVSDKGALGLMQLEPDTAREAARRLHRTDIANLSDELLRERLLKDPELNRILGAEQLRYLLDRYDGDTILALAAYNAGIGRLEGSTNPKTGQKTPGWLQTIGDPRTGSISSIDFLQKIPFDDTRKYVSGIIGQLPANDPRFSGILGANRAATLADLAKQQGDFNATADQRQYAIDSLKLKQQQASNDAQIKFINDNLAATQGDVQSLMDAVQKVEGLGSDNVRITRELFEKNPKNDLTDPETQAALEQELSKALIQAATDSSKALDAMIAARTGAAQAESQQTSNMLARAQALPGTSGNTIWLLQERQAADAYQEALVKLQATEDALTKTEAERASVLAQLSEIQRQLADPTITDKQRASLTSQANALKDAVNDYDTKVKERQAEQKLAQLGVQKATPAQPIPSNAYGATDQGPQTIHDMFLTSAERFSQTSGTFVDTAQTVSDGIYGIFGSLQSGINNTINQISTKGVTLRGFFSGIFKGIFDDLQQTAAKIATNWIMSFLLRSLFQWLNPVSAMSPVQLVGSDATDMSLPMSGLSSALPAYQGRVHPKRFALGGGNPNRDSMLTLLQPGEAVLRKSAVDMVGRDNLTMLNAMGNRSQAQGIAAPLMQQREPDRVNVYVVDPGQAPTLGEKDVQYILHKDLTQGQGKTLVKQIALGQA